MSGVNEKNKVNDRVLDNVNGRTMQEDIKSMIDDNVNEQKEPLIARPAKIADGSIFSYIKGTPGGNNVVK